MVVLADGCQGTLLYFAALLRLPRQQAPGAVLMGRPFAFQPGISPSWRGSYERYALSPVAAGSGWLLLLLLLLSLLLAAAGPVPPSSRSPPRHNTALSCPGPSPEPDCCRTPGRTGSVKVGFACT
jgi:hypothetical protein